MLRRPTLAVTFLTGIPVPVKGDVSPADLWASMGWYPLVGLAMGAAAWGLFSGLTTFLPSPVTSSTLEERSSTSFTFPVLPAEVFVSITIL